MLCLPISSSSFRCKTASKDQEYEEIRNAAAGAIQNMTDEAANESLRVEIEQSGMIVTMLQIYG